MRLFRIHKMKLGEVIRNVLTERDITVKQFAETIGVKRPNAYRIFNQNSIDTALLMKISICLEHDFFRDLSNEYCCIKKDTRIKNDT